MAHNIAFGFLGIGLPDDITVFIVSSLPFLGLRAGILVSAIMGFGAARTLVVCVAGSMTPAPFILIFFSNLLGSLESKRSLVSTVRQLRRMLLPRSRHTHERLILALFVFAALPLPFTGVWAGSIIAAALGLDIKMSLLVMGAGTFVSAVFMMILAFIFPALFWL